MSSTLFKSLFTASAMLAATASFAETDFAPFPLATLTLQLEEPVEVPDIGIGVEYQINACAFVLHTPDVICVPTENGGFVLVPIGTGLTPDDLLGGQISRGFGSTGYVADPDDLINFPPSLWPYIRPAPERINEGSFPFEAFSARNNLDAIQPAEAGVQKDDDGEVIITLPNGLSCPASELITIKISNTRFEYICP